MRRFFAHQVRTSLLCRGLPNSLVRDVLIFFDFFGKLDFGVLFVKVVVIMVNFVFVNSRESDIDEA